MAAASASQHSSSRRHFHWTNKVGHEDTHQGEASEETNKNQKKNDKQTILQAPLRRRKLPLMAAFRLQSIRTLFSSKNRKPLFGPRVVGTLFGSKRGHVNFAFQTEPNSAPAFLVELATPISELVKEMASGLVRIALECDRAKDGEEKEEGKEKKEGEERLLVEEPVWRTFCNGKKCGFATRRECGVKEKKILKAVEPISMGAGALPAEDEEGSGEQVMYMRAKFERIVGSRDSEAFYMMNPDSNGAPELSIYLLRV